MRGTIDGNEAAVDVAYRLTELCAIYRAMIRTCGWPPRPGDVKERTFPGMI